jgi:hypothetical protein
MIELCETEINAVSGGDWLWLDRAGFSTTDVRGAMGQLASQYQPDNRLKDHAMLYRLRAYRAANPDSPTWHTDFFGL